MQIKMQVNSKEVDKFRKYFLENTTLEMFDKKYLIVGYELTCNYSEVFDVVLNCVHCGVAEKKPKTVLMKYDPVDSSPKPYPSTPEDYRTYHGKVAWLYNPYTGRQRDARDIGSDVFGHLIEG